MVQLIEVEDEEFQKRQPGPEEDDGEFTDTGKPTLYDPFRSLCTESDALRGAQKNLR